MSWCLGLGTLVVIKLRDLVGNQLKGSSWYLGRGFCWLFAPGGWVGLARESRATPREL